jgi:hypothetical protein
MNKLHSLLRDGGTRGLSATRCGLTGWRDSISPFEFITTIGTRFEVAKRAQFVTCGGCLRNTRNGVPPQGGETGEKPDA